MPRVGFEPTIPVFRESEDGSCLRSRGHCDRRQSIITVMKSKTIRWLGYLARAEAMKILEKLK
jgi:hypothetical protein